IVSIDDNKLIVVDYDNIFLIENTTKIVKAAVKNFINSINSLVNHQAISINKDILFTSVKDPELKTITIFRVVMEMVMVGNGL
ncbi:MAG: hypothetical protein L0I88_04610, partial [Alkalibacterium sp.]|nr:hypothetical protein [Alkalibacterium sp.]